ncbi:hypothetical protein DTO212C5_1395 [Paecilomyces variotii]|nr:hypothetical protein DTO212C5_1395 [Paecilomyces variotii]
MAPKPTILFIHGAWHTPEYFNPVIDKLEKLDYPCCTVSLPSAGGNDSATAKDDAAVIRKKISELVSDGKEVVLSMHSYGGIPGTMSAEGFLRQDREKEGNRGGVISLVYIAAFLLPEGSSLVSVLGMPPWIKVEGNRLTPTDPRNIFYNDVPPHVADEYISNLSFQALPSFESPLTYPAYQHIPVKYIACELDNSIPIAIQKEMATAGCSTPADIHYLKTGHSPMVNAPDEVVKIIQEAVEMAGKS